MVTRRHVSRADDAERPDREVVHLARLGIDGDRLGEHPAQRHVHRADRVRAQHDLVERIAGRDADFDAGESPGGVVEHHARAGTRARRRDDEGVEQRGVVDQRRPIDTGGVERAFDEHRLFGQAVGAQLRPDRRPRDVDGFPARVDLAAVRTRPQCAGRDRERHAPRSRRAHPAIPRSHSIGGRLGPSRTTSSREYTTRTVRPRRVDEFARGIGRERLLLAAERAAVGERRRRLASGFAPRRVGLEVRGLDPRRREPHAAVRQRQQRQRRRGVGRRAPALHLARGRARRVQATRRSPTAGPARWSTPRRTRAAAVRDERVPRRGVVGEPAAAERDDGSTRCATPPSSCARVEAAARSRAPAPTLAAVVSSAPYTVSQPVHRQRCAASARSSAGRRAAAARASRFRACRTRTAIRRSPRTRRPSRHACPGRAPPRSSPPGPRRARAAVTHATLASPSTSTVQQPHWPCGAQPSFTDTSPSRSRRTDSSDSPGSTGTSTLLPLQVNVTRSVTRTSGSAG